MGWDEAVAEPAAVAHLPEPTAVPVGEASATPDSIMTGGSPLAGGGTAPSAVSATPAQWAQSSSGAPVRHATRRVKQRGGSGFPLGKLIAFCVFLGIAAAIVVPIIGTVSDTIDQITVPTFTTNDDGPNGSGSGSGSESGSGSDKPAKPPVGIGKGSLLLRGNFAPAIRDLRREVGGRVRTLRVAPDNIQVVAQRGGKLIVAQRSWDDEARIISRSATTPTPSAFAWSSVDLSAPRRMAAQMGKSSRFDYAVLIDAAGLRWSAFRKGGKNFQFTPDGKQRL